MHYESPVAEDQPIPFLQILMSHNPQSCIIQNDLFYLCVLHIAPFTLFTLSIFFECGCGTPVFSTYLFFPMSHVSHPKIPHSSSFTLHFPFHTSILNCFPYSMKSHHHFPITFILLPQCQPSHVCI